MSLPNPGMNFTPFDTLPASDLNDMVENIESLAVGTGLDDGSVPASKLVTGATNHGFLEIARTTLSTSGNTITVSSIPLRKYLRIQLLVNSVGTFNIGANIIFNSDTGANYAYRTSDNGGSDGSTTSANNIVLSSPAAINDVMAEFEVFNLTAREKGFLGHIYLNVGNGASVQIVRSEKVGKWANTAAAISSVTLTNTGTGSYGAGSEIIVLGHN